MRLAVLSTDLDTLVECNPPGLHAKLQRFGRCQAYNEQARLSVKRYLHSSLGEWQRPPVVFSFHAAVLPVHTGCGLDHIPRCNHQADGPSFDLKLIPRKLLMFYELRVHGAEQITSWVWKDKPCGLSIGGDAPR